MKIISQIDSRYANITFPGTPHRWNTYGCLASCLCMLLNKEVEEFVAENPTGWTANGDLKTDAVVAKYGFKLIRETLVEGQPLKQYTYPVIYRTSFFSPRFPTHFFVALEDGTFVDPASRYNPKNSEAIRYLKRVNEVRRLEPITNTQCKCPLCAKLH